MTIGGITVSAAILWLIVAIICLIIEAITVGLATIWFAAGAFIALLLSLVHVSFPIQVAVFLVVSVCLLVFTRKIFVEKLKAGSEKTNVDALIGEEGLVTKEIKSFYAGQVNLRGQIWTAVGKEPDTVIEKGTPVEVIAIEGVKLIVSPVKNGE